MIGNVFVRSVEMSDIHDPIVLDPANFDVKDGWENCKSYGDDPGLCDCPACKASHWAFGQIHRCTQCGFEYPTDAWAMFSWGEAAARRMEIVNPKYEHSPYYRYGYDHPVSEGWPHSRHVFEALEWRSIVAQYSMERHNYEIDRSVYELEDPFPPLPPEPKTPGDAAFDAAMRDREIK